MVKLIRSLFFVDQLGQAGLEDRHVTGAQGLDLLGDDVAADHVVAELGKARSSDQADPAGTDYAYGFLLGHDRQP